MGGKNIDDRIDMSQLPGHIAIIMDGNGRWAKQHGKPKLQGHEAGAKSVRVAIEACRKLGVSALSLYAFSTENWQRPRLEVNALFRLMSKYIHREIDELDENDVRVRFMGRLDDLPRQAAKDLAYCLKRTEDNTSLSLNLAINYGGRAEIVDASRAIARDVVAGKVSAEEISEETFVGYLYQPEYSEVDLLIRTSGEMRISNFMLWQLSYAEIVVQQILWPDYSEQDLCDAVVEFQGRSRRFGGRS
jgi:undecaprenyl diphosphate synthase